MLEGLKPSYKKRECSVTILLSNLEEADAKILSEAIGNLHIWTANALSKALRERGITIADHTITKHRNQVCICYKG